MATWCYMPVNIKRHMYMTKSAMAWIFIVKMGGLQWELRMKASKLSTLSSPSYSSFINFIHTIVLQTYLVALFLTERKSVKIREMCKKSRVPLNLACLSLWTQFLKAKSIYFLDAGFRSLVKTFQSNKATPQTSRKIRLMHYNIICYPKSVIYKYISYKTCPYVCKYTLS